MPAPTNAEIAYQQSGLLDRWTLYTTQLRDWLGGVATGGPNGDGAYPLQDVTGQTFLVPCVAAWQAKVDAIADPLTGLQATANQAVTDAQAAQTAAATSETNAVAAATSAQSASGNASMYATNSANSAADSLTYKNAAEVSAANAAASETNAAASATAAATSESSAAASATSASSDATAAANSAQAADASAQQAATYATGRLTYIGSWDVSGGTLPTIGNKGDFYAITGTATIGGVEYANGDMAVSDGVSAFNKIDNTDKVTSVAGLIGTISTAQLQTALNLGTAAYQPTTAFATAAQGAKADSAVQPNAAINALSGTNTGDQDLSGLMPKVGGTFSGSVSLDDNGAATVFFFKSGATINGMIGAAHAIGDIVSDSRVGDVVIRSENQNIRFGFNVAGAAITVAAINNVGDFYKKAANSTSLVRQPRVFVQSGDPGAAAADGDVWIF